MISYSNPPETSPEWPDFGTQHIAIEKQAHWSIDGVGSRTSVDSQKTIGGRCERNTGRAVPQLRLQEEHGRTPETQPPRRCI